jgi:hypothetical protein
MKYAVEMGSVAVIYVPSIINTVSGIQKLLGGDTQTQRQDRDCINLLFYFQNRDSRQKNGINFCKASQKIFDGSYKLNE